MIMDDSPNDIGSSLEASLLGERDKLQQEIEQLSKEIAEKEQLSRAKQLRLGHVQALLKDSPRAGNPAPRRLAPGAASTPTPKLLDMAEEILRERKGEPMHYRALADEIMRRGAVIRGKDPAAALVSRITQDEKRLADGKGRFVRPTSKGFYALREDYPNARNVGARRRRKQSTTVNEGSI